MGRQVRQGVITKRAPSPNAEISVEGLWVVSDRTRNVLGSNEIRSIVTRQRAKVKKAISDSMARAYDRSGLRKITRQLFENATQNFAVFISYSRSSGTIQVKAVWNAPTIPYFFAQLFGADPHDIPNAFGRGNDFGRGGQFRGRFHPGNKARNFIRLDRQSNTDITEAFNDALANPTAQAEKLQRQAGRQVEAEIQTALRRAIAPPRAPRPTPVTTAPGPTVRIPAAPAPRVPRVGRRVVPAVTGRPRLSPFRIRKTLRKAGLSPRQARAAQPTVAAAADPLSALTGVLLGAGLVRQRSPLRAFFRQFGITRS